jgi:hypothetical protein
MCAPEGFATASRPQGAIFGRQKLVSRCSHSVRSSPCKMGAAASFLMLYTDWEWPMRLRGRFAPAWRPHGTIFGRQKLVSRWSHSCDHLPAKWGRLEHSSCSRHTCKNTTPQNSSLWALSAPRGLLPTALPHDTTLGYPTTRCTHRWTPSTVHSGYV